MQTRSPTQINPTDIPVAPPLTLYSWPTVFWRANSRRKPRFRHLATRVTNEPGVAGRCMGHTLWGRFCNDGDAGLAWDWVEVGSGVVAMLDPMQVVTNMRLLSGDGQILTASDAALHFNQFVRCLPWQEEVRRLLQT
jgi:hypothetical protein